MTLTDGSTVHRLVLPYTLCTNDSKFAPGRAFSTADDFFHFTRAAIDSLIEEADATGSARMLSVGLHPRLIGHAARIGGLHRLLEYVHALGPSKVWLARREEIAWAWCTLHPPPAPHTLDDALRGPHANEGSAPAAGAAATRTARHPAAGSGASGVGPSRHRLLITGGTGFALSHVARLWIERHADAEAVLFDRRSPDGDDGEAQRFFAPLLATGRLRVFVGDVGDEGSWARLVTVHGATFTHVVAGAALTPTDQEEAAAGIQVVRVNLLGVLHAFEFARRCGPSLCRFLLVSSDAVLSAPPLGGASLCRPATPAVASCTEPTIELGTVCRPPSPCPLQACSEGPTLVPVSCRRALEALCRGAGAALGRALP